MLGAIQIQGQYSHQSQNVYFNPKPSPKQLWLTIMNSLKGGSAFMKITVETAERGSYGYDNMINLSTNDVLSTLKAKMGLAKGNARITTTDHSETISLELVISNAKQYSQLKSVMRFLDKVECLSQIDLILRKPTAGLARLGHFIYKNRTPVQLVFPVYKRLENASEQLEELLLAS